MQSPYKRGGIRVQKYTDKDYFIALQKENKSSYYLEQDKCYKAPNTHPSAEMLSKKPQLKRKHKVPPGSWKSTFSPVLFP